MFLKVLLTEFVRSKDYREDLDKVGIGTRT